MSYNTRIPHVPKLTRKLEKKPGLSPSGPEALSECISIIASENSSNYTSETRLLFRSSETTHGQSRLLLLSSITSPAKTRMK